MTETFDRAHFAMMTGDDPALQAEIVAMFRVQAQIWVRLLTPDAPTGTWADAAHTAKGSAKGLGLWRLADACAEAETLGRAGAVEGALVAAALQRVRTALDEALNALDVRAAA
jgi:HPt (histidine-containing phosphotransfer) domain-containing protein